ncbi:hypothetical protein, partial [Paenibacillus algorifonticola]|uniref:hypothetical protein n=1 Tax=Paenibacillus algorifonticola TaxID=684063 RepID=UPI00061976CF
LLRKNSIIGVSTLLTEEHPVRLQPEIVAKARIAEPQSFKEGVSVPSCGITATIACCESLSLEASDEIGLQ